MLMRSLLAVALVSSWAAPAAAETYRIDPNHTQVRFQFSHFGYSNIVGLLGGIEGEVVYDPAEPDKAAVSARIPLSSLQTGVADLDQHLQGDDFFDMARHPVATFTSHKVTAVADGRLRVEGDLVIHGETQPIALDVSLNKLGPHPASQRPAIGFDATTTLRRSEFGVGRYVPNVSDEVRIEITVEAGVPKAG